MARKSRFARSMPLIFKPAILVGLLLHASTTVLASVEYVPPVATNPLTKEARPIIRDKSESARAAEFAEDISHDSNAEKRIEVDIPPSTRPKKSTGI